MDVMDLSANNKRATDTPFRSLHLYQYSLFKNAIQKNF